MASDKRPILSGKRARNRRKRAASRAANRAAASPSPEVDSDEDFKHKQPCGTSSDNNTSQSESDNELDTGIVFVCCPTAPDFCSVFQPRGGELTYNRKMPSDSKTFTVHVPSFQETNEGYVTYTVEITTCDQSCHTFQIERRFSEFAACATEVNKQFTNGFAARFCAQQGDKEKAAASDKANNFQWELPSKTWFRVTQTSALEERREQLEQALETLLLQQDRRVCNLPVVRDFLMLDIFGVQVAEQKNLEAAAHVE
ncbi:hypothetical protein P3T76_014707 [Phytophthora citrophthora]|uniref:PX domain-containing protein n=1 Tax=Phytophthora citrophthora TaxID=4793 RepID=A0AAD9G148_9STRA|nr:hypothetical protein P3T76_014707 [Phytophthora citrophthora]